MKVKLKDICEIRSGGTPSRAEKQYWNNGTIPWVKIGDIDGKYLCETEECISEEGLNNSSAKYIEKGSILFTIFATLGEVCILNIKATTNQAIAGITIKDDNVEVNYLYYFLKSLKFHVNNIGRGVAQNNINMSILREFEIPLPEIKKQKEISLTLDMISEIIDKRIQQLKYLDNLIKSRFVEMFGKCVEKRRLEEYTTLITKGASPKWQGVYYCDEGTLFITSENVREGYLDFTKKKYLPNEINSIQPRSVLKRNDVLINIVNASIGRSAIFNSDEHANINQAVALVRIKPEALNLSFLLAYLNSDEAHKAYDFMKVGGDKSNLSLKNISDLMIPFSDMSLQNEFATFVHQVDKLKVEAQKSLIETQQLFDALMNKYFGS